MLNIYFLFAYCILVLFTAKQKILSLCFCPYSLTLSFIVSLILLFNNLSPWGSERVEISLSLFLSHFKFDFCSLNSAHIYTHSFTSSVSSEGKNTAQGLEPLGSDSSDTWHLNFYYQFPEYLVTPLVGTLQLYHELGMYYKNSHFTDKQVVLGNFNDIPKVTQQID